MAKETLKETETCPLYTEPTPEQIAAEDADMAAFMNRFYKIEPLCRAIKRDHEGQSYRCNTVCPNCGAALFLEHRPNGHMSAKCETPDCCSFIE